jgi:hypothetical protein
LLEALTGETVHTSGRNTIYTRSDEFALSVRLVGEHSLVWIIAEGKVLTPQQALDLADAPELDIFR